MALNETLQKLASQFNLTTLDLEPDPYILTAEEEQEAIRNAVDSQKKHAMWKMKEHGMTAAEIDHKAGIINWVARIDKDQILKTCNANKTNRLWEIEQRKKDKQDEKQKADDLKKHWTALRLFRHLQSVSMENGKPLIVNADTLPLIKTICYFISGDERFESEIGHDLKKGLLIRGVSGLGKTYIVKCLASNGLTPINVVSMLAITDSVRSDGEYKFPDLRGILYLDDVGTEESPVKYYGTTINFFKDFLELYYSNNRPFNQLMISTNNSFSEMEEKYGFRVRSRIKDMFNIVNVEGKDLRG